MWHYSCTYYLKHYGFINDLKFEYYGITELSYLAHHGILGQKWGKRNGPPYPLDYKSHNKVVSRAFKGHKNKNLVEITKYYEPMETRSRISPEGQQFYSDPRNNTAYGYPSQDEGYNAIPKHSKQKDSKEVYSTDALTLRKAYGNKKPEDLQRNPEWLGDDENKVEKLCKGINPYYHTNYTTVRNNCYKCAAALTLRKMGINQVEAGRTSAGMRPGSEMRWFDGVTVEATNDLSDIQKYLDKMPNGSFGMFGGGRKDAFGNRCGGHEVGWTKTRSGKIRFEDAQADSSIRIYNSLDDLVNSEGFADGVVHSISRVDNATPDWSKMEEDGVVSLKNNLYFSYGANDSEIRKWRTYTNYIP